MSNGSFILDTPHGIISITDTALKNDRPALLLIHGNSSSSKIFKHILASEPLTQRHRIITFDLPGHGASSDAPNPEKTYWMRGYADLAQHILAHLGVETVVVLGWSLGGHVGIELVPLLGGSLKGLMIVGTPPSLGVAQTNQGFRFKDGHLSLTARKEWTEDEVRDFARSSAGAPFEDWMEDAARRTDGRARLLMWKRFAEGVGVDQRGVVESADVRVAVVNGAEEPYVDLDYLDGIRWKRLWKGRCWRLEGLKHAPFWERPAEFEKMLVEFLEDCAEP